MSAEFIYAMASLDDTKENWVKYINDMETEEFHEFGDWLEAAGLEYGIDGVLEDEGSEGLKKIMLNIVESVYDEDNNELGFPVLDNKRYVLTGGFSYGDDPTESFYGVCLFSELQNYINCEV